MVGAGSAGVAAAIAAGRRGDSVLLVEASPLIGGLATYGLINLLLTLDDGAGTQVVAGLCQEMVDRMQAAGQAVHPPPDQWNVEDPTTVDGWRRWGLVWGAPPEAVRYSVAFDPDAFVDAALDMLGDSGVRLRLLTWFAGVIKDDDRIDAVVVESKRGREAIKARVVIDATGDGDVLVSAGADHEQIAIPPNLWFRVGGVDVDRADPGLWFRTTSNGRVLVPWGPHPNRVDATDPDDMTRALLTCRAAAKQTFDAMRSGAAGFEGAWLDGYAPFLGITESRRLVGDYVLEKSDGDRRFDDTIARTGHWTRRNVIFDIPYRCLTTPAARNLVVSGRCISTSRYVHQATKEIPAAMATGEAAGAAAVHATSGDVRLIDVGVLRDDLARRGAIV